jgi:hypothetical protein
MDNMDQDTTATEEISSEDVSSASTASLEVEPTVSDSEDTKTIDKKKQAFSQKQVDTIVAKRVGEVKQKYGDYDELKGLVETLTTERDELQTKYAESLTKLYETKGTIDTVQLEADLKVAANKVNLDFDLVTKLIDYKTIQYDSENKPTNISELIRGIVEKYPGLVRKGQVQTTPTVSGNTHTETPKFTLSPVRSNNFFSGGGVVLPSNLSNGE